MARLVRFPLIWLALMAAMIPVTELPGQDAKWRAGVASAVITPKESMWMAGYASRKSPSEGAAISDLYAKALAIEDGEGHRCVLVTLDLISVPKQLRDQVAAKIKDRYKIDAAGLLMNCSHTHCGPVVRDNVESSVMYSVDAVHAERIEKYFVELRDKIIDAIGQAVDTLAPAKLGYSHARCGFAMNRRLPTAGGFQNSPYPEGPVDHDVPVLKVEVDGQLKAILFGYACHNTTTAVMQYNADYAGFAQAEIEAQHPGVTALFVLGCGGDQNPYPRGKIEMAKTHGQSLASAVEAALLPTATNIEGTLSFGYEEVELPFAPLTREEVLERKKSKDPIEVRRAESLLADFERDGHARLSYPYPVQTIRFGKTLTMVTLGGEVVVDYSLRLKKELPGAVWVAGYSNDVMAYIASERVLAEGGYEGGGAMRYSNLPNPWRAGLEERIISTVHYLLNK